MHKNYPQEKSKIHYRNGYNYKLAKTYKIKVPIYENASSHLLDLRGGVLTIKRDFSWDGITYGPDLKTDMRAGLVHDALMLLLKEGKLSTKHSAKVNEVYRQICLQDGDGGFRSYAMFYLTQLFSRFFLNKGEVLTAP